MSCYVTLCYVMLCYIDICHITGGRALPRGRRQRRGAALAAAACGARGPNINENATTIKQQTAK